LVELLGGVEKCDPNCEEADGSVCLYTMFVMRDALKYLGLHDKKVIQ